MKRKVVELMQYENLKFLCECTQVIDNRTDMRDIVECVGMDDDCTLSPHEINGIVQNLNECVELGYFDENDATFMLGLVSESASTIFGDGIFVTEGKNLELRAKIKPLKKEYTTLIKGVKKAIKYGDYTTARKNLNGCEKVIKELSNVLDNAESDTFASAICGNLIQLIILTIRVIVITLLSFPVPIIGYLINVIITYKSSLDKTFVQINDVIKNKKIGYSDINGYKLATKALVKSMEDTVAKFDKVLAGAVGVKDGTDSPDPTTTKKIMDLKEDLSGSLSTLTSASNKKK